MQTKLYYQAYLDFHPCQTLKQYVESKCLLKRSNIWHEVFEVARCVAKLRRFIFVACGEQRSLGMT